MACEKQVRSTGLDTYAAYVVPNQLPMQLVRYGQFQKRQCLFGCQ